MIRLLLGQTPEPTKTGVARPSAALLLLLLAALEACGSDGATEASGAAGVGPDEGPAGATEASESGGPALLAAARSSAARARIRSELPAALDRLVVETVWRTEVPPALSDANPFRIPSYRREVLGPLYAERDQQPAFVSVAGGLTESAEVMISELRAVDQHVLDPAPYRLVDLNRLEPLVLASEPLSWEWALDAEALAALEASLDASGEADVAQLAAQVAGLEGDSPAPALAEQFQERVREARESLLDELELELVTAHAFLSYAFDMKHFNLNRMTADEITAAGGQREVQRERLRRSFRDAAGASPDALAAQLEALYPPHEQYPLLMTARARYREIVAAGGWERVRGRRLSAGQSHARVADLKRRLAVEGFYEGPIDNQYDDALVAAVTSYQESHQMQVTGEPHDLFWSSLNIPAERRLAQIELNIRRWRETWMRGEDYYVFINVPDFHAEVWRDGALQRRFRIVVGNTDTACNPRTGRMEYINATPLQYAQLEYLVFNPFWNVPPRIRRDELDVELLENPAWLQENGYEVVVGPYGPRVRQLPGPTNALGAVKFIFPNIHNTYMHDTPNRRYFDFPIRNFSHGCMRVQDPLDYAELLLRNDGQWDPDRIQRIRDSAIETVVRLEEHVPVFIEYYVVRVDQEGRTNFLADIYRYDRAVLDEWEQEACVVPGMVASADGTTLVPDPTGVVPEPEPVVLWNEDGSAVTPDGTVIFPDGRIEYSEARVAVLNGESPPEVEISDDDAAPSRVLQRRDPAPVDPDDENPDQPDPGDIGP